LGGPPAGVIHGIDERPHQRDRPIPAGLKSPARCLREIPEPDRGIDRSVSEAQPEGMSVSFVAPTDHRRQLVARDRLAAACLPLPIGVLAALDALPFDVHVRHGDRSVLYALRDSAPRDLLAHAGPDMDLVVPLEQARPYRRQLVACLVDLIGRKDRSAGERAQRIVNVLGPLLEPFVGDAMIDPGGLGCAGAGLAIVARAVSRDRDLAERILGRPAAHRGISGLRADGDGPRLDRSIDAAIVAALVAPAVEAEPAEAALAAAARDVGMIRDAELKPAHRRHPLVAADLVAASGGSRAVVTAIATHHERRDGSGDPVGLVGEALGPAGRAVALADAFVTMIRGVGPSHGIPIADAFWALRIVTRGRFDDRAVIALADVVGAGAGPRSRGQQRSTSH
jgi:hypothetical protein